MNLYRAEIKRRGIPIKKLFDREYYLWYTAHKTQDRAEAHAQELRTEGYRTRIVLTNSAPDNLGRYSIYIKKTK